MRKYHQKQIELLTGQFIGWGDDLVPHCYIKLATDNGELFVKVAKSLRPLIQDWKPGIWLKLLSHKRVNPNTGETNIKAKQLLTVPRMDALNMPVDRLSVAAGIESSAKKVIANPPTQIRVCQGSSCRRRGSEGICQAMESYFDRHELTNEVKIQPVKCLHQCKAAPHAIFTASWGEELPDKTHYRELQSSQIKSILIKHFPIVRSSKLAGHNTSKIGN